MKRKKKKLFKFRTVFLLIITIYLLSICFKKYIFIYDLKNQIAEEEEKIDAVTNDIEDLKGKIEKGNSLEFVESIARDELKMVKPGEYIYIEEKKNDKKDEE